MSFIETVKAKAKSLPQTIVLPESQEPRNLEAAEKVLREGIAKIILLGKREEIMKAAQGRDLAGATFIDPLTDPKSTLSPSACTATACPTGPALFSKVISSAVNPEPWIQMV